MRPSKGMSFVEILLASVLLLVIVVPLGLLLSQSTHETRATRDEYYATLYLTELVDQVASLPYERLPNSNEPFDLTEGDPRHLVPLRPSTAIHVSPMEANFTKRSVRVRTVASSHRSLKEVRARVVFQGAAKHERSLEMVTYVGRGKSPGTIPGGR